MQSLDKSTKVWIRPGVSFWEGKNGAFIDDDLTKQNRQINSTAYFILQRCHGLTVGEIIDVFKEEFKENREIEDAITMFLEQLRNEGLIIEVSPKHHYGPNNFPLGLVFCELTHSCNFKCKTCYNNSGRPNEQEMSTSEWKIALKKIADVNPEIQSTVILTGGEPLFRKDFFEIASYAKDLGLFIQLFTNGSLIDRVTAEKIARLNIEYVRISVDGASSETNDKIRGKGNFDKAFWAIPCAEGRRDYLPAEPPVRSYKPSGFAINCNTATCNRAVYGGTKMPAENGCEPKLTGSDRRLGS
jgi:hypothetical protein